MRFEIWILRLWSGFIHSVVDGNQTDHVGFEWIESDYFDFLKEIESCHIRIKPSRTNLYIKFLNFKLILIELKISDLIFSSFSISLYLSGTCTQLYLLKVYDLKSQNFTTTAYLYLSFCVQNSKIVHLMNASWQSMGTG
jgi:hypothetical protein